MSMMLSLRQAPRIDLRQICGETAGEVPMYSLHRIKRLLQKEPPAIGENALRLLKIELIKANMNYREETGNDWACLTSNGLVEAIEGFSTVLGCVIEPVRSTPMTDELARVLKGLEAKKTKLVAAVKCWFKDHAVRLDYDMSGKVPWAVTKRLRADFGRWVSGHADVFQADIEEVIVEVARAEGIETETPTTAWERMGGQRFETQE